LSRGVRLALLAALVSAPSLASAYAVGESHWNPAQLPIRYYVNASSAPTTIGGAAAIAALDAGMASWAAPVCTRWRTTNAGATAVARGQSGDRTNTFLWVSGSWPAELGPQGTVIGVTTPVWTSGGYFIDADIQFNNVGFVWSTDGRRGTVDTQSIATHEEGHFLGLDHSSQSSAVMYASYSGGIKRTLTADDQGGVCAIYPSGTAAPDAGTVVPEDPCARYTTCAGCTPVNNCGWCGAAGRCVTSTQSGPVAGACGNFVWLPNACTTAPPVDAGTPPPVDAGPAADPCSRFTACGGCTPYQGCGWCGATSRCQLGTETGPNAGACASGWAWTTADCTRGSAAFGEPCSSPTDCASGGLCVGPQGSAFCTRTCTLGDDCTCPRGYSCNGRIVGSATIICVQGTNRCVADAGLLPVIDAGLRVDAGLRLDTGVAIPDVGVVVEADAGTMEMKDAAAPAEDTGGAVLMSVPADSGCGCRVPGTSGASRAQGAWALAALGAVLTATRRRRR
jgi:MYXO-CTERM domain-containing protein